MIFINQPLSITIRQLSIVGKYQPGSQIFTHAFKQIKENNMNYIDRYSSA